MSVFYLIIFPSGARNHIKICNIKKVHFGQQVLTWHLIRASSLIPLNKPSFKTFEYSTKVFLPFSVLVSFLSPRLSFTFRHRILFSSFHLHFVASFSWTPDDPKLMFLFVYQFSFSSPKSKSHDKYKIYRKLVSRKVWYPKTRLFRAILYSPISMPYHLLL